MEVEQKIEESMKSDEKAVKDFVINLFKGTSSSSELKFDIIKGKKQGHKYELKDVSLTQCKFQEYSVSQSQTNKRIFFKLVGFSMGCSCKFSIVGPLFLKKQSINIRIMLDKVDLTGSLQLREDEIVLETCEVSIKSCLVSYDDTKNEKGGLKFLKKHVKIRVMKILKDALNIDELVRKKLVSIIEDQLRRNLIDCLNFYLYPDIYQQEEQQKKLELFEQVSNIQETEDKKKKDEEPQEEDEGENDEGVYAESESDYGNGEQQQQQPSIVSSLKEENEVLKNALLVAEIQIQRLEKTKESYKEQIIALKKLFVKKDRERMKDEEFKKTLKTYFLNFYMVSLEMNMNQKMVGNFFSSKNELRKEFLNVNFNNELEMIDWLKEKFVV